MPFNCEFSSAFSNAFAICDGEPAPTPTVTPTLVGVPSLKPRKRPEVADISGVGYVSVLGAGKLTGEACLAGNLQQEIEGSGSLVLEGFSILIGRIQTGAEAVLCGSASLSALAYVMHGAQAWPVGERLTGGVLAQPVAVYGRPVSDVFVQGRMSIQSGGEAALTPEEHEESLILMAATWIVRRLTG